MTLYPQKITFGEMSTSGSAMCWSSAAITHIEISADRWPITSGWSNPASSAPPAAGSTVGAARCNVGFAPISD